MTIQKKYSLVFCVTSAWICLISSPQCLSGRRENELCPWQEPCLSETYRFFLCFIFLLSIKHNYVTVLITVILQMEAIPEVLCQCCSLPLTEFCPKAGGEDGVQTQVLKLGKWYLPLEAFQSTYQRTVSSGKVGNLLFQEPCFPNLQLW